MILLKNNSTMKTKNWAFGPFLIKGKCAKGKILYVFSKSPKTYSFISPIATRWSTELEIKVDFNCKEQIPWLGWCYHKGKCHIHDKYRQFDVSLSKEG